MAIQADNKIVLGGYATNANGTPGDTDDDHKDLALARLTTAGALDGTFGTGGKVTTNFSGSKDDVANAIAIQPSNGKIVVAGHSQDRWLVARYNTGGALDGEFGIPKSGGTGRQGHQSSTGPNIGSIELNAVAIKSDGKIVVSGHGLSNLGVHVGESARLVFRLETNGEKDDTSSASLNFDRYDDQSRGMALLDNGKTVLGGYTSNGTVNEFSLSRYNANGSLDDEFGMTGEVRTSFGSKGAVARSVALLPDGKIVAAGYAKNDNSTPTNASDDHDDFAIARYGKTGAHDISFGNVVVTVHRSGRLTRSFSIGDDRATAVGVHGGKTIVTGHGAVGVATPADDDFIVASYQSSGETDTTFGKDVASDGTPDGWQHKSVIPPGGNDADDQANAMVIQSDGKIVVAGYGDRNAMLLNDFAVMRFTAAGELDDTFGVLPQGATTERTGIITTDFNSLHDSAQAIAMVSGGGFVTAGYATNDGGTPLDTTSTQALDTSEADDHKDFAVALYSSVGALNTAFATDGKVTLNFNGGHDEANAVAVDGNDKFVVAGYASNSTNTNKDFAVVRYNANGSLDTSFSSDGKVTTAIGSGDDVATAMVIQSNGKIVVAGYSHNGSDNDFALVRYNADGTLDTSFGIGGKVTTNFGKTDDRAHGMVIDDDGFILLAGQSGDEFALARYLPQRSLSTDTRLSGLAVQTSTDGSAFSAGTLSPAFAVGTTGYTMAQLAGVTHVKVTPTTRDPNATVTVQGQATARGSASAAISVTAGSTTTVSVVVTAEDGKTTRTYTISVQVLSNEATLSGLSVSTSTDGSTFGGAVTLTPAFASGTSAYETNILAKEVTHVKVTPTVSNSSASVTVNGTATASGTASSAIAVTAGSTTNVNVVVTAADGLVTQTYTIGVRVRAPGAHIAVAPNPVAEGAEAQITVTIPAAQSQNVTIPITTTAVSAESGDYSVDASVVVSAGSLTGTGTLRALQDADADNETLTVALGSSLPAQITAGSPNSVTVTIDDDEFESTVRIQTVSPNPVAEGQAFDVTLGISPAQPNQMVIPLRFTHTTSETDDISALTSITIAAGQTNGSGQIQTNHDIDAHDETFTIALGDNLPPLTTASTPSSVVVTIDDDEFASQVWIKRWTQTVTEGESAHVVLGINPPQTKQLVIPVTLTHGTSEAGDFSSLSSITIDAHQTEAAGTIRTNHDSDAVDEQFTVTLGSNMPLLTTPGSRASVTITIDDDEFESYVKIDLVSPNPVVEGETIYVRLKVEPPQPNRLVIPLTFTHGTSESGDFSSLSSITVDAGQSQGVGQIRANQDSDQDDETVTVALGSNLPSLIKAGTPSSATIAIDDDDDAATTAAPRQRAWPEPLRRGDSSLKVTWFIKEDHSPYTSFDVEYREKGTTSWTSVSASATLENNRGNHTITGLSNGTTYQVRVRARNPAGTGPWPRDLEEGTPIAPPNAPTGVTVQPAAEYGFLQLDASWTAPSSDVTSYHLRYRKSGETTWKKWFRPNDDVWWHIYDTSATIRGLTSGTTYEVQVRALIDDSVGAWSATATGTTE